MHAIVAAIGISMLQLFLQGSMMWQTDRQTDRPRYLVGKNRYVVLRCGLIMRKSMNANWNEMWRTRLLTVKAIFSEGFTETVCTGVYFQWIDSLKMQKQYSIFSEEFTETMSTEIYFQWMVHWNIGHWNLFSVNSFDENKVKKENAIHLTGCLPPFFRLFSLYVDIWQILWRAAGAKPDLRLPSKCRALPLSLDQYSFPSHWG